MPQIQIYIYITSGAKNTGVRVIKGDSLISNLLLNVFKRR